MPESSQGASPSSRRYFFRNTHVHRAICMATDHRMRFVTDDGLPLDIRDGRIGFWKEYPFQEGKRIFIGCGDHFYVAPDSLHLLQPREGDLYACDTGCGWLATTPGESWKRQVGHFRIIQRNGIAFHWPESEAA